MGSVKRDLAKKSREYDGNYPYEALGVKAVLRDIHRLSENRYFDGDIDATTIVIDLRMALDSRCLTPRMRQIVFLYYFVGVTLDEIADITNLTRPTALEALNNAVERVATEMEYGYHSKTNARITAYLSPKTSAEEPLYKILNEIADNERKIYEINDEIVEAVVYYLARKGDTKAQEALRQRLEGYTYVSEKSDYPALTWDQMKWYDRRQHYLPDVYYDDRLVKVGFRKIAELSDDGDGGQWSYNRQRLFAKRN